MEDYRQRLQTSFVRDYAMFLNPAHKKSICDWHILQFGYDLWLLFLSFFADLQKENMERRQGFINVDFFVSQASISPTSPSSSCHD